MGSYDDESYESYRKALDTALTYSQVAEVAADWTGVCITGGSYKFYQVYIKGSTVNVNYGKIGTSGNLSTKKYSNHADAVSASARVVAEKKAKGYFSEDMLVIPKQNKFKSKPKPAPVNPEAKALFDVFETKLKL